jgi:hypothetical protein
MRKNGFLAVLLLMGVAALGIFVTVLLTRSGTDRQDLWKEAGKAALQVFTVAVLGGVLKLLADHYKDEQERLAQDRTFRQDKYDRSRGDQRPPAPSHPDQRRQVSRDVR